jgi:cell division protein FtsW
LQKLIDDQIATEDQKVAMSYSIEDKVSNPMNAVLNK